MRGVWKYLPSGKLAGRANWSGRGHPIEGSVEIPAKWQTGRYSQSESSGTEGLGSGPVWERVARQGQMETHGRSSVQGGVSIRRRRRRGINNKRTIATS